MSLRDRATSRERAASQTSQVRDKKAQDT
jgi:hypothetical protein